MDKVAIALTPGQWGELSAMLIVAEIEASFDNPSQEAGIKAMRELLDSEFNKSVHEMFKGKN